MRRRWSAAPANPYAARRMPSFRSSTAAVLGASTLALALASPAAAGCGTPVTARAAGHAAVGRAPLAVGDSTSIYAAPRLGALGVEADARGCRQFPEGLRLVRARHAAGTLPAVVVLALGANGPIAAPDVARVRTVLGPRRVLVLVTARHSEARNVVLRAAARAHPEQVVLADWAAFSAGHAGWFAPDGLHPTPDGAAVYARYLRRAVARFAFPPVRRLRVPRRRTAAQDCGPVPGGRRVYVVRGAVTCLRATQLARAPVTRAPRGWTAFDWRRTHVGPWSWVIERADHRTVVAVVDRPPTS